MFKSSFSLMCISIFILSFFHSPNFFSFLLFFFYDHLCVRTCGCEKTSLSRDVGQKYGKENTKTKKNFFNNLDARFNMASI